MGMRFLVLILAAVFTVAGQTNRPAAGWFADRGIELYPNLVNPREMPAPTGKERPGHMLNAQTHDPQEQVVAFYKSKYPEAKGQQQGSAYRIEGTTAKGGKFSILLTPSGSTTAVQYTTEK